MPPKHHPHEHAIVRVNGKVTDIFAHRFVLQMADGKCLADLTPHGADAVELNIGDDVAIEGEQKPSEIKVLKLERSSETFVIGHKPPQSEKHPHHPPHHHHRDADPFIAKNAATSAGYEVVGEPRRKPKHFEVLGKKGQFYKELHVELDGSIHKQKPIAAGDPKWHEELASRTIA
jgi:hypothetical protein